MDVYYNTFYQLKRMVNGGEDVIRNFKGVKGIIKYLKENQSNTLPIPR